MEDAGAVGIEMEAENARQQEQPNGAWAMTALSAATGPGTERPGYIRAIDSVSTSQHRGSRTRVFEPFAGGDLWHALLASAADVLVTDGRRLFASIDALLADILANCLSLVYL